MPKEISLSRSKVETEKFTGYQVNVSDQPDDPQWDAFLVDTPGGHHVQTSLWAKVKVLNGYRAVRIAIKQPNRTIVAGAQILIRQFPIIGSVGFVSKGPLFAINDPVLEELTVNALLNTAKRSGIQYLLVQPANNGEAVVSQLSQKGFRPININLAPTATVLLDLHKDLDTIMAEMKRSTRYNIRLGQRKGITVRQGTEMDLDTYYEMLKATSQRQDFSIYSEAYYKKLWDVFYPRDFLHLFIAEYEGEVVSAQITIAFGDTVINKLSVWSGQHGKHRPNEVLLWSVIEWAKGNGFHYYDLEGVNETEAREIIENKGDKQAAEHSVTSFKLGFSENLVHFPGNYLYIASPLLRPVYKMVYPKIADSIRIKKIVNRIRTK